jgi:hypothetical protein
MPHLGGMSGSARKMGAIVIAHANASSARRRKVQLQCNLSRLVVRRMSTKWLI